MSRWALDFPSRWAFPLDRASVGRCARERLAEQNALQEVVLSALTHQPYDRLFELFPSRG